MRLMTLVTRWRNDHVIRFHGNGAISRRPVWQSQDGVFFVFCKASVMLDLILLCIDLCMIYTIEKFFVKIDTIYKMKIKCDSLVQYFMSN